MHKLLYATILGLVGAGLVHIAILFMLPSYSERDIWSKLSAIAAPYEVEKLGPGITDHSALASSNPMLLPAACRFDLADGPLRLQSQGTVPFWSLSIYDGNGLNIFSITDRTATDRTLDFVGLDSAKMQQMRAQVPEEFNHAVFVELGIEKGVALVRVFSPGESWQGEVDAFLSNLTCRPLNLG